MYLSEPNREVMAMTRAMWTKFGAICCALSVLVWGAAALASPGTVGASSASVASAPSEAPLSTSGPLPHPVDVPTGPQASAASCPNPPQLSSPLPAGASISAPSLVPPNTASLTGAGQTYDLAGTCEYTLTFPSASSTSGGASPDWTILYVGSGHDYYYPTGVADGIALDYNNQTCGTSAEIVSAYGLAVAEQELVSGYCNTRNGHL
jgi:hypothetical protein